MFPRVRLVNCRCTAGNYHRKLSGFPVVALLPVVSACCQARMSFFLHHVATNYILKKSPLLLSQLSWQASFLAACQKKSKPNLEQKHAPLSCFFLLNFSFIYFHKMAQVYFTGETIYDLRTWTCARTFHSWTGRSFHKDHKCKRHQR